MAWNERDSNAPTIAICTPHTGDVSMEWVHRTWGPLVYNNHAWCNIKPCLCRGPPIDLAREHLVEEALEKYNADYVFFLDSDVIIENPKNPARALNRLVNLNLPIVSGLYRAKKHRPNYSPWAMWQFKGKDKGFEPIETFKSRFVEVDVAGLGCCLVKAEVFQKIEKPWFRWDIEVAPSEDFYFLMKARAAGFKVVMDTSVRCSHVATMKILPTDKVSYDTMYV